MYGGAPEAWHTSVERNRPINLSMESDSCSGGGAADDDLLERARRLCLAAQLISDSLPKFSIRVARGGNQDEETTATTSDSKKKPQGSASKSKGPAGGLPPAKGKGKTKSNISSSNQSSLPPAVLPATPPPQVPPRTRSLKKQKSVLSSTNQETLPEITIPDKQRKAREAEKVRQAQERARARVARTSQSDQLEAEREIETRRQQLQHLEEVSAEKERLAEQSRLRAEERIRMKRQLCTQLNPIERQQSPVCHPEKPLTDPAKIERFRKKTLARLHALPRNTTPKTAELEQGELVAEIDSSPERNEDAEAEMRKQKEKKFRQKTAERIRRQQAVEEEQRRKEQELIQQGLLQYKNRQKELDRVAKGLGLPRKVTSVTKQLTEVRPHSGALREETADLPLDQSPSNADAVRSDTQEVPGDEHPLRHDRSSFEPSAGFRQPAPPEYDENELHDHWTKAATTKEPEEDQSSSLVISLDQQNGGSGPSVSRATSGGKRKLPSWKRAPVPILPAEFYSSKAVIPASPGTTPSVLVTASNSYTEKFKVRTPTASSSSSSAPSMLRATKPSSREASSSSSSSTAAASRVGSATRDRI